MNNLNPLYEMSYVLVRGVGGRIVKAPSSAKSARKLVGSFNPAVKDEVTRVIGERGAEGVAAASGKQRNAVLNTMRKIERDPNFGTLEFTGDYYGPMDRWNKSELVQRLKAMDAGDLKIIAH